MMARARIAALFLSVALIVGAIVIPARGHIAGQPLSEIIWITIDAESLVAAFGDVITAKNILVLRSQKHVNGELCGFPSSHLLFSDSTQYSMHFLVRPYNSLCNNIIDIRRFVAREVQGSAMGFYSQIDRWGIAAVFPVWVNVPCLPIWTLTGYEQQCRQDWINERALARIICCVLFSERVNCLVRLHARGLHLTPLSLRDRLLIVHGIQLPLRGRSSVIHGLEKNTIAYARGHDGSEYQNYRETFTKASLAVAGLILLFGSFKLVGNAVQRVDYLHIVFVLLAFPLFALGIAMFLYIGGFFAVFGHWTPVLQR
jgi:hypothetical protein